MSEKSYIISGVVDDGTLFTGNMDPSYERGYISVIFYSDEFITPVTPSAGTLTFEASEEGINFGTITDGVVTASVAQYDRPNFSGSVKNVRAIALGITGATHYRATIHRFKE